MQKVAAQEREIQAMCLSKGIETISIDGTLMPSPTHTGGEGMTEEKQWKGKTGVQADGESGSTLFYEGLQFQAVP